MAKPTKRYAHLQSRYDAILAECVANIAALGYRPEGRLSTSVRITRNTRRMGSCKKSISYAPANDNTLGLGYDFQISCTSLIADNEDALRDTLYHEVIHTLHGCFNHGKQFKKVMREVNAAYHANVRTTYEEETYSEEKITIEDVKPLIGAHVAVRRKTNSQKCEFIGIRTRAYKRPCIIRDVQTGAQYRVAPNYIIQHLIKED